MFNLNKIEWETYKKNKSIVTEKYILEKINERLVARKKGDFKLADKIREDLFENGIVIEDLKGKNNLEV